ncbi:hypothetical protein K466DRAFT_601205 [Polyporus arcularius HHB13444]|uniref:BTB domain-containing protein n=1 Tax=Polyporus arcularius HHB13444 TaxID=1314778 RepID=A0A5C3P818_9APHY|nr:hypothetical protein K466DRAFT_601205 [Polyporus arcularius HHB13444]
MNSKVRGAPSPKKEGLKRTHPTHTSPESPNKRPRPYPVTPQVRRAHWLMPRCDDRDKDLWYPDGNVIIYRYSEGRARWFKLYRTRLAQYCGFFDTLLSSSGSAETTPQLEGCPVYTVPAEVSCDGLSAFFGMLEKPRELSLKPLTQDLAISLVQTAHALSCSVVFEYAQQSLSELWSRDTLPGDSPVDAARTVTWKEAMVMITVARKCGVLEILKRAFYELLVSEDFWVIHDVDSATIDLPDEDIYRLREMRLYLNREWPKFVITPPQTDEKGKTKCTPTGYHPPFACEMQNCQRRNTWLNFALDDEGLDTGARDPLRYNLVKRRAVTLEKTWCQWCLNNKEEVWNNLRMEWWGVLGDMMKI